MEACSTPFAHTRQDEGPAEDHRTSHSLTTERGPCTVRPTKLGPAWTCVNWAVPVIKYTVMTVCNPPCENILGINQVLEGLNVFDKDRYLLEHL